MKNIALESLNEGHLSLGLVIRTGRGPETGRIAAASGFDWIFLDLEHSTMSLDSACVMALATLETSTTPLARVPVGQYGMAARLLDGGVQGIVIPHIETVDQAREVVSELRYPPLGRRSVCTPHVAAAFQPVSGAEQAESGNDEVLIAIMLETAEGIANCQEIAAVDGVDVIMIGATDLSHDLGLPDQVAAPRMMESYQKVATACAKHGRIAGVGGVRTREDLAALTHMGYRFILSANDVTLLLTAGRARTGALRDLV